MFYFSTVIMNVGNYEDNIKMCLSIEWHNTNCLN